jgi:Protein of unknown function (DUF1566)
MKTTLCLATAIVILAVLTPLAHAVDPAAWNTKINGPGRFTVLTAFNKEAVFDKETGLVWQRSPNPGSPPGTPNHFYEEAQFVCNTSATGGRFGWRLPTLQELASLLDPSVPPPGPTLPVGHPFINVQAFYWSATTLNNGGNDYAWFVNFSTGGVGTAPKFNPTFVWCVRGGQGVDPQ